MVVKSKGIPPEMSETFRFRNYSHSNVPKYYPPKKTDMSREQLWHWKMIISFWNGPFFGEMRLFSRGITPANLSSNDPLVRLKTSTPSKTHMTIEKQPWVKMYLLWKKTADFPAIAMSVNLRDIPTSPADCTKVGPTPIPGSWPLLLGQKNGDPKGMNLDGNFSEVSCKFLGVYHLRWIYVTWVCVWLFLFFLCVCVYTLENYRIEPNNGATMEVWFNCLILSFHVNFQECNTNRPPQKIVPATCFSDSPLERSNSQWNDLEVKGFVILLLGRS